MRALAIAAPIALGFLVTGCPAVDWKELQFTRHKPSEQELVGTWRPTAATLKEIRGRGHYPVATHEIIVRADHTFSIRNMPDWWSNGFGESHGHGAFLRVAEGQIAVRGMERDLEIEHSVVVMAGVVDS